MAPTTTTANPLHLERISQYVSLPPAALTSPLPALCASIFSPLLLSYFPPARGIVLAYEDVTLSSSAPTQANTADSNEEEEDSVLLRHVDEYSSPFLWATATFLIWRPEQNTWINARITSQRKTHITLSYLNVFPVSVLAGCLPEGWEFRKAETTGSQGWDEKTGEEGGVWVDGQGEVVEGDLEVRVLDFDGRMDGRGKGKGFLRLEGSLLTVEQERVGKEGKGKGKRGILKKTVSVE